jgi:hypothetical protein
MLTIGDPLCLKEKVTTLTDTSQGSYRRMAILDDRLIGYLSLGQTQPDSMAMKRIIDEGHPVRDIIKPLLKGTFDARSYLSQRHSRAAHGVLTSAKLPALSATRNPVSHVELLPLTEPRISIHDTPQPATIEEDDEISPFTGNLPSISGKIVESTLAPAFPGERSPSGSLWAYAKAEKSGGSSRNLWSYGSEERS